MTLIPKSNPEYDDILRIMKMLKDRKQRDFADYDRVIVDYQISGKAPDYHTCYRLTSLKLYQKARQRHHYWVLSYAASGGSSSPKRFIVALYFFVDVYDWGCV